MPSSLITVTIDGNQIEKFQAIDLQYGYLDPISLFTINLGIGNDYGDFFNLLRSATPVDIAIRMPNGQSRTIITGQIDQPEYTITDNSTDAIIKGRNYLGLMEDSGIDGWSQKFAFKESTSLLDLLFKCGLDFGVYTYVTSNVANREIISGADPNRGHYVTTPGYTKELTGALSESKLSYITVPPQTQLIDPTAPTDLKTMKLKELKPEDHETYLRLCERVANRFHLHVHASFDDPTLMLVTKPNTSTKPNYFFYLDKKNHANNVISCKLFFDYCQQPSAIFARGYSGGGGAATSMIKCAKINEFIGFDFRGPKTQPFQTILDAMKVIDTKLKPIVYNSQLFQYTKYFNPPNKPRFIYFHDHNSKTQDQLEAAVNVKMSHYQRKAMVLKLTVNDFQQNNVIFCPDSICHIEMDQFNINDNFYIDKVTMHQSVSGGSYSVLDCIPIGSIRF